MKKFISNLFIILYAVIAIFVTVCLLSLNDYQVTEFGNYSLIIIDSNDIKGDFKKGSLVIVDKDNKPEIGDKAFFYDVLGNKEITLAEVKNKQEYRNSETTYTFEGDYLVSGNSLAGSAKDAVEIPHAGTILSILESKWGYLFLVVLISLLAFLYEITRAVEDIRESRKLDKEEENIKKEEVIEEDNTEEVQKEEVIEEDNIEDSQNEIIEEKASVEPKKKTSKKKTEEEPKKETSKKKTEEEPKKETSKKKTEVEPKKKTSSKNANVETKKDNKITKGKKDNEV